MERGYWIKSKPQYSTLSWHDNAIAHVLIAKDAGCLALIKLFQIRCPEEPLQVFITGEEVKQYEEILKVYLPDELKSFQQVPALKTDVNEALKTALMGTQFYIAGDEGFIWECLSMLDEYGVQDRNVEKELCGSLARVVYCVHCKNIDREVHHDIHQCSACQRHLFVRDHFSRRLGAYMGVMIDAEEPGAIPQRQEVYP